MTTNHLYSITIGLGWLLAILMAFGLFAMANFLGDRYAHTQLGVSRMGPKLGKLLTPREFSYRGTKVSFQQLVSNKPWTMFLFLDASPVSLKLAPDLVEFATISAPAIKIVVFCKDVDRVSNYFGGASTHITTLDLEDIKEDIQASLGVRVLPFALLVDDTATLMAKGLVNHMIHLCLLVHNAEARTKGSKNLEVTLITVCNSVQNEIQRQLNFQD